MPTTGFPLRTQSCMHFHLAGLSGLPRHADQQHVRVLIASIPGIGSGSLAAEDQADAKFLSKLFGGELGERATGFVFGLGDQDGDRRPRIFGKAEFASAPRKSTLVIVGHQCLSMCSTTRSCPREMADQRGRNASCTSCRSCRASSHDVEPLVDQLADRKWAARGRTYWCAPPSRSRSRCCEPASDKASALSVMASLPAICSVSISCVHGLPCLQAGSQSQPPSTRRSADIPRGSYRARTNF